MVKILCADTTSDLCSVSLFENGDNIGNEYSSKERSHSKLLLKLIDDLMNKSKIRIKDIDCFSISRSADITESGEGLLGEFLTIEFATVSIVNKFSMILFKLYG